MGLSRWMRVLACALAFGVVTGVTGCRVAESETASPTTEAEKTREKAPPTLEEFVTAETKMADFTLKTYDAEGALLYDQTGTLWVTSDRFRYDLYQDGELIRSIQTPDGETAYFVEHADQTCEPAVAPVANYRAKFDPPPTEAVEDGIDEETGALRMKYELQELYTVPGASNSWFQEDIVFLVKDDAVIGIITTGHAVNDGEPSESQLTRRMLSNLEAGVEIDDSVFELPYPVQ